MNETHNPAVKIATEIMESIAPGLRSNKPAGALLMTTDETGDLMLDERPIHVGSRLLLWLGDRWHWVEYRGDEYGVKEHFAMRIPAMLGTSLVRMFVPNDAWLRWPPKNYRNGEWLDGSRA